MCGLWLLSSLHLCWLLYLYKNTCNHFALLCDFISSMESWSGTCRHSLCSEKCIHLHCLLYSPGKCLDLNGNFPGMFKNSSLFHQCEKWIFIATGDIVLVMSFWFITIAREGICPPNTVLPSADHNGNEDSRPYWLSVTFKIIQGQWFPSCMTGPVSYTHLTLPTNREV